MKRQVRMNKLLSVLLAIALVITTVPFQSSIARAANNGNSFADAEVIQLNQTKTIPYVYDDEYYYCKFEIPEQGIVTVNTMDKKMKDDAYTISYSLYNSNGEALWSQYKSGYNSYNPNFKASVGLAAGTYILCIENRSIPYRGDAPLDLRLDFKATQYCEIESNETIFNASPMELNQFYEAHFAGGNYSAQTGEYDFFSFPAEKGKFYRLTMKNYDEVAKTTMLFSIYDPQGESYISANFRDNIDKNGDHYYEFSTSQTGKYFIKVWNYHGKQVPYSLKVGKCPFYPELPYRLNSTLSTAKGGYDDVCLSWEASKGATGYQIYMKKYGDKGYKYVGKTAKTSYIAKDLADGSKYYFAVKPYYYNGENTYKAKGYKYTNIWTLKRVSTPSVKKYSKYSPNYVDVAWKKVPAAYRYEISKSTKKTGTYVVATTSSTSYTYLKTTLNKGYYYKVRAYAEVYKNGKYIKIYAPWSQVKYYKATK